MKKVSQFIAIMLVPGITTYCSQPPAQDKIEEGPSYKIAEGHALVWDEAIKQILELAEAMPEEGYSFKPHDSVMTFAEQLVHIGGSSNFIANKYLMDTVPQSPEVNSAEMSKAEIAQFVESSLKQVGEVIKSMSDQQLLDEQVESFSGNKMSRLEGLLLTHDHLTNHKAKANLYVRISGNEPPKYRYY